MDSAASPKPVAHDSSVPGLYPVPDRVRDEAHVPSIEEYKRVYEQSIRDPDQFWGGQALANLHWLRDFDTVRIGTMGEGNLAWFLNGKLNACLNCVDRHVEFRGDQVAIIWESDEPGKGRTYTYKQVLEQVCRIANVLKRQGVRKGDTVAIYMPMMPELAFTMLACARLGAPHSVVFAGFSADSLRERILDAQSQWVVTADQGVRGGRTLHLKQIVDEAVEPCACVKRVFVFRRTGADVPMRAERDLDMAVAVPAQRPEDLLFLLYTSGSTGRPKGVAHTTAGYLLYTMLTCRYTFDLREGDVFACVADCGWVTGHSYIVYGPLANGATTVMFESTPLYPDHGRYWDLVQRHRVTQLYTAPTAIRALMRHDPSIIRRFDLSSLRVLGTVGEPINPEAWRWYYHNVGQGRCAVVDTFWQTETGGHMLTPLAGATPTKPGSACLPFFGIRPVIVDKETHTPLPADAPGAGLLCFDVPWPGMMRTVYGDHERFITTYLKLCPGMYFTGDGCHRDTDGYYWVTGRVDDVLNVSGHRLGSAEVESALVGHRAVAEAAAIGFPHDLKGQGLCCFVTLKAGFEENEELIRELKAVVRHDIGPIATPDVIVVTPALPKTRSGKIMRRLLRKVAAHETAPEQLGDISTLADPDVMDLLIAKVASMSKEFGSPSP